MCLIEQLCSVRKLYLNSIFRWLVSIPVSFKSPNRMTLYLIINNWERSVCSKLKKNTPKPLRKLIYFRQVGVELYLICTSCLPSIWMRKLRNYTIWTYAQSNYVLSRLLFLTCDSSKSKREAYVLVRIAWYKYKRVRQSKLFILMLYALELLLCPVGACMLAII